MVKPRFVMRYRNDHGFALIQSGMCQDLALCRIAKLAGEAQLLGFLDTLLVQIQDRDADALVDQRAGGDLPRRSETDDDNIGRYAG